MATGEYLELIPARLKNAAVGGYVAGAEDIIDDDFTIDGTTGQSQADINSYLDGNVSAKADKLPMTGAGAATENNFMAIDANGNIKDSGKKASDFLTQHQSIKTINSASIVGSGNVDLQVPITDNKQIGGGYYTCSTASDTTEKVLTIEDFQLKTNCRISVLFTNAFTTRSASLNINNGGAHNIVFRSNNTPLYNHVRDPKTILTMVYANNVWNITNIEREISSYIDVEDAVDLGLPSGILWRDRNLGATNPEDYGLFFSWGNTEGIVAESGKTYDVVNSYNDSPGSLLTGSIGVSNDAAHVMLGGSYRMPTRYEFNELINYCTWTAETINNVNCWKITSNLNGNFIIFPKNGGIGNQNRWWNGNTRSFLWTSDYQSATHAWRAEDATTQADYPRCYMFGIRPVL